MTDERGYNGWTNYETWCVNMWLSNDERLYDDIQRMVSTIGDYEETHTDRVYSLQEDLMYYVRELAENVCPGVMEGASFVVDLFNSALGSVDWHEIADALVSDWEGNQT